MLEPDTTLGKKGLCVRTQLNEPVGGNSQPGILREDSIKFLNFVPAHPSIPESSS